MNKILTREQAQFAYEQFRDYKDLKSIGMPDYAGSRNACLSVIYDSMVIVRRMVDNEVIRREVYDNLMSFIQVYGVQV